MNCISPVSDCCFVWSLWTQAAGHWFLCFGGGFVAEGGGFLVVTLFAVVRAGRVIHHKDRVSFSLLAPRLLFLKQNSPQRCNIGACNWTTEPQAVNSPPTNKYTHCQTLVGKKMPPFLPSTYLTHTPLFFFFSLSLPLCLLHSPIASAQ